MICQTCGREVPNEAKFCTYCGGVVEEQGYPSPDAQADPYFASSGQPLFPYGAGQPQLEQQGSPYGAPPQQLSQPSPYDASPQQPLQPGDPYGASPQQLGQIGYTATPVPPKKKKTWIIILVIALVLVCCVGGSIAGYILYQNISNEFRVTDPTPSPTPDPSPEPKPDPNGGTGSGNGGGTGGGTGGATTPQNPSDSILVDSELVTITILNAEKHESLNWVYANIEVENKTNRKLWLTFDTDLDYNNLSGEPVIYLTMWTLDTFDADWPANSTTQGQIVFNDPPLNYVIKNFTGTLQVFDSETYELLGEYKFKINQIG